jgi:hypothetical protein
VGGQPATAGASGATPGDTGSDIPTSLHAGHNQEGRDSSSGSSGDTPADTGAAAGAAAAGSGSPQVKTVKHADTSDAVVQTLEFCGLQLVVQGEDRELLAALAAATTTMAAGQEGGRPAAASAWQAPLEQLQQELQEVRGGV